MTYHTLTISSVRVSIIWAFLAFSLPGSANDSLSINDLRKQYSSAIVDTTKYQSAQQIARNYESIDQDSAEYWYQQSISDAQKLNEKHKGDAFLNLGNYYLSNLNYESAADNFIVALDEYKKGELLEEQFNVLRQLASVYLDLGNYLKVLDYQIEQLNFSKETGNREKIALSYHDLGYLYFFMGEYYLSLENYLQAMDVFKNEKLIHEYYITSYYCAMLYFQIGDYENCEQFMQEALAHFKTYEAEHPEVQASYASTTYKRLALLDIETANYQRGLAYCDSAFAILKDGPSIGWVYAHIGVIYTKLNNYEKAKENFDLSKQYVPLCNHCYWPIYTDMSEYFLHFGIVDSAIYYGTLTLERAVTYRYDIRILRTYRALSEAYYAKGDLEKAFEFSQKYIDLYNSALNKRKMSMLKKAESDFYTQKSDAEIKELNDKNAKQRLYLIFSLAIAGLLSFTFVVIFKNQKQKQRLLQSEKEMAIITSRISGQEEERSRLARELHDGVVADLSGIRINLSNHLSESGNKLPVEKVISQINDISKEIRTISHNLSSPLFTNTSLEDVLKSYILQFTGKKYLNISLSIFPQVNWSEIEDVIQKEIYRIFQEVVNNTIKHSEASELSVQIVKHDSFMNVVFEDNGKGFSDKNNKGIGLKNIKERVQLLNGDIDIVSSEEQGCSIALNLPLSIAAQKVSLS